MNVLVRSAEEIAVAEREPEEKLNPVDELARKAGWRNLLLAISLGIDTRPLAGVVGSRINGRKKLAVAVAADREGGAP